MYQSPITVYEREFENHIVDGVYKAVKGFSIDVDKEELLKALQYDRGQYSKGYGDGYSKAIDEVAKALKERCKRNLLAFDFQSVSVWEINRIVEELKKHSNEIQMEEKGE